MQDKNFDLNLQPLSNLLAYGVIGNTPVFGTVIQGSSPCRPTLKIPFSEWDFYSLSFFCYILKVITGLRTFFETLFAILPLNKLERPLLPCVVIAMISASISFAKFMIPFTTEISL